MAKKTAVKEAKRAGAVKVDKMKEDYNQYKIKVLSAIRKWKRKKDQLSHQLAEAKHAMKSEPAVPAVAAVSMEPIATEVKEDTALQSVQAVDRC